MRGATGAKADGPIISWTGAKQLRLAEANADAIPPTLDMGGYLATP